MPALPVGMKKKRDGVGYSGLISIPGEFRSDPARLTVV